MKYMTVAQYEDIQRLLNHLNKQNYFLSEVEIEMVVFDNIEYILNYYRENSDKGSFYTLLSTSIKRKIYNKLRDTKRYRERMLEEIGETEVVRGSDFLVLSDEFYDELDKVIKGMKVLDANILYLYIMGESSRSTAKILEVSRHKVLNSLKRTKAFLHKRLADYGVYYHSRHIT